MKANEQILLDHLYEQAENTLKFMRENGFGTEYELVGMTVQVDGVDGPRAFGLPVGDYIRAEFTATEGNQRRIVTMVYNAYEQERQVDEYIYEVQE